MDNSELAKQATAMLRETAEAHHTAFIASDGEDAEWPLWYAEHLCVPLSRLLHTNLTKSELVFLLVLADKEHRMRTPDADWAPNYARLIVEQYR